MSKPYDATPKFLIDFQPSAWSKLMGYSSDKVKICNVDLSTITTSVDTLLLVGGKRSEGLHLEFQSRYDRVIGERILVYNVLASRAQQVSIHSVLFCCAKRRTDRRSTDALIKYELTGRLI